MTASLCGIQRQPLGKDALGDHGDVGEARHHGISADGHGPERSAPPLAALDRPQAAPGCAEDIRELVVANGDRLGRLIDDVLDLAGDPDVVGKSLFADLHEGKMTYPLLLAMERAPQLAEELAAACEQSALCLDPQLEKHLTAVLWEKGVVEQCISLARLRSAEAISALSSLPASRARSALEQVALALVHREK